MLLMISMMKILKIMIYFVHDVIAPRSKSVREFAKYPTFIDVHLSDWY